LLRLVALEWLPRNCSYIRNGTPTVGAVNNFLFCCQILLPPDPVSSLVPPGSVASPTFSLVFLSRITEACRSTFRIGDDIYALRRIGPRHYGILKNHRRGRNGGCPPSPAQIPACSFPALGSSEIRRFRSRNTSRVCHCHQGGWHCFSDPSPDNVSFDGYVSCQPLPHVSGFPALGVLWVDPTSYRPSVILLWVG
jgi:hypothetical protein